MSKAVNHRLIRVPTALHARLTRIAGEIDLAKVDGRSLKTFRPSSRGTRHLDTPARRNHPRP